MAKLSLNNVTLAQEIDGVAHIDSATSFPAGHVIQVASDLNTVGNSTMDADILDVTITGTTFATGYTVNSLTITPTQATSKLVLLHTGMVRIDGTQTGCDMYFAKNGNQILTSGGNKNAHGFVYHDIALNRYTQSSINDVITAGTTSPVTISVVYSLYVSGTLRLQHDGSCSLIVMEVQG